jgi:hypothetical protein
LPLDSLPPALNDLITQVYAKYAALMSFAAVNGLENPGGKLLYAGELDAAGRSLAVAGNIAGAATLAATADQAAARQAMREGTVDFVVTTLDEALRILKNQVRKREPVSVSVGRAPEDVEREMLERGVEPDLIAGGSDRESGSFTQFVALGARVIEPKTPPSGQTLFTFEIPVAHTRESARIEEIMAASLAPDDHVNRRWLRLSPRFLGSGARRVRSVMCDASAVAGLRVQLERLK